MGKSSDPRPRAAGQTIVIFVLALVALLAMTGLVIDGGNAYAQQRATQNGADSASEAGASALRQHAQRLSAGLGGLSDADVLAAVNQAAADAAIASFTPGVAGASEAYYTDFFGTVLQSGGVPIRVGAAPGGAIPTCPTSVCVDGRASGVQAGATREFSTFISGVVGLTSFRASAPATAVTGYVAGVCSAAEGCALLPITFATLAANCEGTSPAAANVYPGPAWTEASTPYTAANEKLLTICKNGEGAYGWLDFGCGNTANQISQPCNVDTEVPTWLVGQPGNPNNVEAPLEAYFGNQPGVYEPPDDPDGNYDMIVRIPFFDAQCNEDRPDGELPTFPGGAIPGVCANNPSGGGANRHYHIPWYAGFILDRAYVQGNNFPECNNPPAGVTPLPGGNGSGGCFIGWFARINLTGPLSINPDGGNPLDDRGVKLIK